VTIRYLLFYSGIIIIIMASKKTDNKKLSNMEIISQGQPVIKDYIISKLGRPVEYMDSIGEFICLHIAIGLTVKKICNKYNSLVGDQILHPVKIYRWLKSDKLSHFRDQYYYAREIQADQILDHIIEKEEDIENLTLESKAGRVILESLRWRAKVQCPDYFNPVQKTKAEVDHTFVIKTEVPEPRLINKDTSITVDE